MSSPTKYVPHQNTRECARRKRQAWQGKLTPVQFRDLATYYLITGKDPK